MAGHLLLVILMSFVHEIQAQALLPPTLTVNTEVISETDSVTLHCQAPTSVSVHQCFFYTMSKSTSKSFSCRQNFTATELLLMSHHSSPAEVKVRCFYTGDLNSTSADSEPSSITIQSQTPQMTVQHFNGEHVRFVCSLPGSVKDDTRCNLYFGEASRLVLTAAVGKNSRTKNKQRFCQFYVSIDDFLRHLHFVQQKDASCDYTLKREPRSLSPRSDRYNLTAILESELPKINKPSSIMTTESSLSKLSASTSTSVNSITGLGTLNLNPTTGVNTPVKTTQYRTSRDSTTVIVGRESRMTSAKMPFSLATDSSLSTPSASSPTTSVNSPSDSYKTNATMTITTVKVKSFSPGPTFTWSHTSTRATATSVDQPDSRVNSSSKILQSSEASIWKLAVAVTGLGVTMGVILLVLGLLTFKRRSETCSQSRTKATSPGDFISMTKMNQGRMLPAGNDGGSSVITSVPDDNCLTREKLNLEQTKNEDSDIYHVYATISEATDPPDSQDTIYSTLNAH
ncbi:uncharacterized protein LOC120731525 isoform X2 [Simochromis diagramma]|uniref:uncharacterized protein LOC120731525 isoform X2 n=1 Tax=Simochromis diagramma TaxID=43689 RepID=UPI001A7EF54A|nr:uncharacterized protein LOC120731525 isoform X2 [Simochromis diagramma]